MGLPVRRKALILGVALLLVVSLVLVVIFIYSPNKHNKDIANSCTSREQGSFLYKASTVFDGTNPYDKLDQYQGLADHAKAINGFDQEPNCLYPVMYYQHLAGEVDAAYTSLEQFEKIREGKEFAEDIYSKSDIYSSLAGMIRSQKELMDDPTYFGGGSYAPYPVPVNGSDAQ